MSSSCPECKRRLGAKTTCRCGWVMPGTSASPSRPAAPMIACCFGGCNEAAVCRVYTKTGWANVCRTDYSRVDFAPQPRTMTPFAVACRKAWENSYDYRRRHGGTPDRGDTEEKRRIAAELELMKQRMAESLGRQPGDDDERLEAAA